MQVFEIEGKRIFAFGGALSTDRAFTDYLDEVRCKVEYKKWFCGHFHVNRYATNSDNIKVLYEGTDVLL